MVTDVSWLKTSVDWSNGGWTPPVELLAPSCWLSGLSIAPKAVLSADRRLLDGAREAIIDWMGYIVGGAGEIRVCNRSVAAPSFDRSVANRLGACGHDWGIRVWGRRPRLEDQGMGAAAGRKRVQHLRSGSSSWTWTFTDSWNTDASGYGLGCDSNKYASSVHGP
jgi:hypothetical protein